VLCGSFVAVLAAHLGMGLTCILFSVIPVIKHIVGVSNSHNIFAGREIKHTRFLWI
jgi:hypothetical protein